MRGRGEMQDDLNMILSGKLNLEATINNINKQIGQIEKQLKDIDITLNVGNIEKVVSTVSKSTKVVADTATKELSKIDKVVNGIFNNLGIDKVSKELRDNLSQMLREVANGTGDISEDIISKINKLAMESKKNIDYAKSQYKELNAAKISDGESIYNYIKEHKDGRAWGKIKPMREEFDGIDGFKESLRGLISISEEADMTLENLQSEMAGANLIPKDIAEMGNMQDFALYLRDALNEYRKFRDEITDSVKVPDMTNVVFDEIGNALPEIAKLENSFSEVNSEVIDTISNVEKLNKEIDSLNGGGYKKGKVTENYSLINGEDIRSRTTEYTNAELKDTVKIIERIIDESNELVAVEKVYTDNIKKRNDEQEKLLNAMAKGRESAEFKTDKLDRKEELKQSEAINKALEKQYEEQEKLKTQAREIALLKKSAEASIDNIVKSNDGADVKRANDLKIALSKIPPEANDAKLRIRELNAEIKEYGVRSKEASSTSNSFADSLKRFTAFYGIYDLFQLGKRGIESMLDSIFDLDHALVELQKTSNLTGESLGNFVNQSYQIAGDLARTGTEVINAAGEFSKAGFGEDELANLAETALLLTNVGDGIKDVADASGTLISAMKGFDIESRNAIEIVDKINAVSNSTASNFEDVSFGLERMSGTLGMAGASIDETIGMFTAVFVCRIIWKHIMENWGVSVKAKLIKSIC